MRCTNAKRPVAALRADRRAATREARTPEDRDVGGAAVSVPLEQPRSCGRGRTLARPCRRFRPASQRPRAGRRCVRVPLPAIPALRRQPHG
jgi:hypothetical protein